MGGNFVNQQKENCMKNNIFKIIIFFLALVSLGACDDGCEDYLDQYESILYFKNNGEQHVTIYDTSNEASCEFTVIRAGYNSKKYSTVDVSVLDAVNIQIYNAENETDYKLLPDNCFKLETPTLAFEDTDNHKKVKAFFYIDKIKEWTIKDLLTHTTGYESQMMSERFIQDIDKDKLVETNKKVITY